MAEFALIFPIFALILFGLIDLGRYVFIANQLGNAAREAARAGAVAKWPNDCAAFTQLTQRESCITAVARNRAQGQILTIAATDVFCRRYGRVDNNGDGVYDSATIPDAGQCQSNDILVVKVATTFNLVTPLIAQFIGNQTIRADATVTVNN
jgi:Flp pilus assembly protein TadG